MILYNGAKFHPRFLVQMRGSVMPFSCLVALPCALAAVGLKMLFIYFLDPQEYQLLGVDLGGDQVASAAFSGMNFLIGFLVVFRAQTAYQRFWEGCTAISNMQGYWFDAASALVAFCKCSTASMRDVILFQHTLVRLVSLLNACVLMELSAGFERDNPNVIAESKRAFELELIDAEGIDCQSLLSINSTRNKVELLFQWIQQLIVESSTKAVFSVQAPILSRTFQELSNGMVYYRQASKIARVPLPFPYVQATEMLLISHAFITPFLMSIWIVSPLWTGVLTFVQVAFFWSLNSIATELENPFGEDANDLPAQEMQHDFNRQLLLLLRPSTGFTARLSHKAAFNETNDLKNPKKLIFGKAVNLGTEGIHTPDVPRHKRRGSLDASNRITLGNLQESIQSIESRINERSYVSESSDPGSEPGSRKCSKENGSRKSTKGAEPPQVHFASSYSPEPQSSPVNSARPSVEGSPRSPVPASAALAAEGKAAEAAPAEAETAGVCEGGHGHAQHLPAEAKSAHGPLPPRIEEKFSDGPLGSLGPLPSSSKQYLSCLPELLAVCEEVRDHLRLMEPGMMPQHLACLPEVAAACRDLRDQVRQNGQDRLPIFGESPQDVPETPLRSPGGRRPGTTRGVAKPVDGCFSLRSCGTQEAPWSQRIKR